MAATTGPTSGTVELHRTSGVPALRWAALDGVGVDAVVTTRVGGVSSGPYEWLNLGLHVGDDPASVLENRRRAAALVGSGLDDLVVGAQVHGAAPAVVTAAHAGRGARVEDHAVPGCDALVTTEPGLVLAVLVADCAPLVLVDPVARVLAAVHAGWRGTAAGVATAALGAMVELGASPGRVVAAIGPTVCPRTYDVGPEVVTAVRDRLGAGAPAVLRRAAGGRWLLDVAEANRLQLLEQGVPPDAVHRTPFTTTDDRFYSHRAARPCGRFGLLARLR